MKKIKAGAQNPDIIIAWYSNIIGISSGLLIRAGDNIKPRATPFKKIIIIIIY